MYIQKFIFFLMAPFVLLGCRDTVAQQLPVIPVPQKMEAHKGVFVATTATVIVPEKLDEETEWAVAYLNGHFKARLGKALKVQPGKPAGQKAVSIQIDANALEPEAYQLTVGTKGIVLKGGSAAGIFYGVQTLIQLFPDVQGELAIPAVHIEDHPAFSYRGMHLDVGRHFFRSASSNNI